MVAVQELLWFVAFGIGAVAAWLDWKTREVTNNLWILGLLLAVPLLVIEIFQDPLHALIRWGCFAVFFAVTWALWRSGSFGAADAKAFSFFALVLSPVGYYDLWAGKIFPSLDILVTTLFISWLLQKFTKREALPMLTVSFVPLLLAPVAGGLVWWPIVGILDLFV